MFYCTDLLRKNDGKFAAIWLASVYGKNIKKILTRWQITGVDVTQACTDVLHPNIRLSLRLQSNLMLGILRVYFEQVSHFCDLVKRAWQDLRKTFYVDSRLIDLQKNVLSKDVCTLPDPLMDGQDFPVFLSHRFPMDDEEFMRVGFQSPASSTTSSSPHTPKGPDRFQTPKENITMPDITLPDIVEPIIKVAGEEDLTPPMPPIGEDMPVGFESPVFSPTTHRDQPPDQDEQEEVHTIDPETGQLRPEDTSESRKRQHPDLTTPSSRIEPVVPERPQKRRRRGRAVDIIRKLSDEKIKKNHLNVSKTLRDEIIDLPLRLSAEEILNNPSRHELRGAPFFNMWQRNAVPQPIPDDEVPELFSSPEDSEMTPEAVREGETHDSEYDRTGSMHGSKLSSPGISSPTPDKRISTERPPSTDWPSDTLDEEIGEVPVDDGPSISPILERSEEEEDDSFEHKLQSHLAQVMGEGDQTSFSEVFPYDTTNKAMAAKGLFQLLEWHRRSVIVLSQPQAGFNEIYIERGLKF